MIKSGIRTLSRVCSPFLRASKNGKPVWMRFEGSYPFLVVLRLFPLLLGTALIHLLKIPLNLRRTSMVF